MADEEKAATESSPKKSKVGLIIGLLVAVLTLIGGSVAGAILGPKLLAPPQTAEAADGDSEKASEKNEAGEEATEEANSKNRTPARGEPEQIFTAELPAIVVDLRDEDGRTRHLKVGLSAELMDEAAVAEFKLVIPRGREAALSYLRSLTFEEIADPKKFNEIKSTLSTRVTEAVGAHRVHRILLVEFVAQ